MEKQNTRLYLIFISVFLVMHFTGVAVSGLPYVINGLITSAIVLTVLVLLLKWNSGGPLTNTIKSIGFQKTSLKSLLPGAIMSVVLLLSYPLLSIFLNTELILVKGWYLNVAGLFLTGGLTEEVLFRGYFFGSLRTEMKFSKAAFISAVCFSLVHLILFAYMDWAVALLSTLLAIASSIPLAFLYEFGNRTVWSPAIVHATIRTVGLVIKTADEHFLQFSLLWIAAAIALPYFVLVFYKDFRTIWNNQV
jgi:membrane protease YdiL (CAAX protease family)